jgi:hypothetical protein
MGIYRFIRKRKDNYIYTIFINSYHKLSCIWRIKKKGDNLSHLPYKKIIIISNHILYAKSKSTSPESTSSSSSATGAKSKSKSGSDLRVSSMFSSLTELSAAAS